MPLKKVLPLNNGEQMPLLGFGTWQIEDIETLIGNVIDAGYSHIDCAHRYTNEKEIGKALKKKFDEVRFFFFVRCDSIYFIHCPKKMPEYFNVTNFGRILVIREI